MADKTWMRSNKNLSTQTLSEFTERLFNEEREGGRSAGAVLPTCEKVLSYPSVLRLYVLATLKLSFSLDTTCMHYLLLVLRVLFLLFDFVHQARSRRHAWV